MATSRGGCTCVATSAASTAIATKAARRRTVRLASRLVSSSATASTGPNSPTAPTDRMVGPKEVLSTPVSRRTGSRVPRAVVVRHNPTTTVSRTSPVALSIAPTASARTSDASQDDAARVMCPSRRRFRSRLGADQEHQVGQPQVGQRGDNRARVRQCEHVGPDQDAEADLDDDLGDGDDSAGCFRQDRSQHRRQGDEDQRRDGLRRRQPASLPRCTACRGTPKPPPGHTLGLRGLGTA